MAQYKIIKPINAGSGYLKDINGNMVSMQSLAPKVGDIINGTIETKYIFNKYMTGISFPITTGSNDKAGNSAIFIPKDSVEVYNIGYTMRPADIPPAPNSNTNLIQEFQFIKPFSTTYSVGGINPLRTYSKKSMELIKGVRVGDFVRVSLSLPFGVGLQGAQDSLLIPMSYLTLSKGKAQTRTPTGTQAQTTQTQTQTQTQGSPTPQKQGEAPKIDQVKTDEDVKTDSTAKLNLSDDKILGLPKNTVILLALVVGGIFLVKKLSKK